MAATATISSEAMVLRARARSGELPSRPSRSMARICSGSTIWPSRTTASPTFQTLATSVTSSAARCRSARVASASVTSVGRMTARARGPATVSALSPGKDRTAISSSMVLSTTLSRSSAVTCCRASSWTNDSVSRSTSARSSSGMSTNARARSGPSEGTASRIRSACADADGGVAAGCSSSSAPPSPSSGSSGCRALRAALNAARASCAIDVWAVRSGVVTGDTDSEACARAASVASRSSTRTCSSAMTVRGAG